MNSAIQQIEKSKYHDWTSHDFIWLLILTLVVAVGSIAFNVLFAILCLYAFFHRNYSITLIFFSGHLKIIPIVSNFPVDFTAITFAFFLFYTVLNILNNKHTINANKILVGILLSIMFCIVSISILRTPASFSYLKGSAFYLLLNIITAISILLFWDLKEPRKILLPFCNFSIAIGILWIGQGLHNEIFNITVLDWKRLTPTWHISAFGEDYMAFSTFAIFLIIRFGIYFVSEKKNFITAILLLIFLYCLIASPARGLTIGLIFSILFVAAYTFSGKISPKTISSIALLAVAGITLVFLFREGLALALNRLTIFDTDTRSIKYRLDKINFAFEKWSDQVFLGTGIDSIMYFKREPGGHVHNVILETVIELGLIGGLPFLLFFGLAFYCFHVVLKRSIKLADLYLRWISMTFLIFFIFSLFSGSLSQIRPLWIIMTLVVSICIDFKSSKDQQMQSVS